MRSVTCVGHTKMSGVHDYKYGKGFSNWLDQCT